MLSEKACGKSRLPGALTSLREVETRQGSLLPATRTALLGCGADACAEGFLSVRSVHLLEELILQFQSLWSCQSEVCQLA